MTSAYLLRPLRSLEEAQAEAHSRSGARPDAGNRSQSNLQAVTGRRDAHQAHPAHAEAEE